MFILLFRLITLVNIVVQFLLALSLLPLTALTPLPLFVTNFSLAMHILKAELVSSFRE